MAAPLDTAIVVRRNLVLSRRLPREAKRDVLDALVAHRLIAA
jgi:hypothetical protein